MTAPVAPETPETVGVPRTSRRRAVVVTALRNRALPVAHSRRTSHPNALCSAVLRYDRGSRSSLTQPISAPRPASLRTGRELRALGNGAPRGR